MSLRSKQLAFSHNAGFPELGRLELFFKKHRPLVYGEPTWHRAVPLSGIWAQGSD